MFFLQLPPTIPSIKGSAIAGSKAATESSKPPGSENGKKKSQALGELPKGFMGKMLVYRSGVVKLKLGDTLYDVSTLSCRYEVLSIAIHVSFVYSIVHTTLLELEAYFLESVSLNSPCVLIIKSC